jgi:hypothetical protein
MSSRMSLSPRSEKNDADLNLISYLERSKTKAAVIVLVPAGTKVTVTGWVLPLMVKSPAASKVLSDPSFTEVSTKKAVLNLSIAKNHQT